MIRKSASVDSDFISRFGPIDREIDARLMGGPQREFSGDEPNASHNILWNIDAGVQGLGGYPEPSETTRVVVVGGGMSGLISSYLLRDHSPVVLERARRFGGNARGENWKGIDYSLGAAYVMGADPGSDLEKLHNDIGLREFCRYKTEEDPVVWKGKPHGDFWSGETDPKNRKQFVRLKKYFLAVLNGEEFEGKKFKFPDLPVEDEADREWINTLDRESFKGHLERILGETLHPHIASVIEHYCWSSFGASMAELSAAAGMNFFAAEFGEVIVAAGGNSAIAERVLKRLQDKVGEGNLRSEAIVVQVRVEGDGVITTYLDGTTGKLRAIRSETVIMSCPKFVVKRILKDIEPDRLAAIARLKYRSYLVANLLIKKPLRHDQYDWYLLGEGKVDFGDVKATAVKQGLTDVIFANFAKGDAASNTHSILSLYRALPYDFARPEVLMPGSFDRFKAEFEKQIHREVLPLFNLEKSDVDSLRMARWGHPMPVAEKSFVADGVPEIISRPFKDRVFFAEQDNWALPCFETVAFESQKWTKEVARILG